jgi:hypothetical protein
VDALSMNITSKFGYFVLKTEKRHRSKYFSPLKFKIITDTEGAFFSTNKIFGLDWFSLGRKSQVFLKDFLLPYDSFDSILKLGRINGTRILNHGNHDCIQNVVLQKKLDFIITQ